MVTLQIWIVKVYFCLFLKIQKNVYDVFWLYPPLTTSSKSFFDSHKGHICLPTFCFLFYVFIKINLCLVWGHHQGRGQPTNDYIPNLLLQPLGTKNSARSGTLVAFSPALLRFSLACVDDHRCRVHEFSSHIISTKHLKAQIPIL